MGEGWQAVAVFDDWPAAHTAKGPKASRPPLGRLGALLFSLWGGPKNRNQKDKHKKYKKSGHAVCSSASLRLKPPPKGTPYRCQPPNRWAARLRSLALRGPQAAYIYRTVPFPGFHNPEKGSVRGGTSSPHPRGPGAAAPGALCPAFSRESRNPRAGSAPRGSGPPEGGCPPPPPPGGACRERRAPSPGLALKE